MRITRKITASLLVPAAALGAGLSACGEATAPAPARPPVIQVLAGYWNMTPDGQLSRAQQIAEPSTLWLPASIYVAPPVPKSGQVNPGNPSTGATPRAPSNTPPMTATTGGPYGGGAQNPCNSSAGNGLGDCTPGGGTNGATGGTPPPSTNYGTAPGSTPPPYQPDGPGS